MTRTVVLLTIVAAVGAMAQPPAPQPAPAAGRGQTPPAGRGGGFGGPAIRSPEVGADKTVAFRLRAPNATAVTVRGLTQPPLTMQKDASGLWTATTPPLKTDLYAYTFVVGGLSIVGLRYL